MKCEFFHIYELVPKHMYESYQEEKLWYLFDSRLIWTLDALRKQYGKMTINDWYWGGSFQLRGFRPADSGVGAALSQHRFGRAIDTHFASVPVEAVRKDCIANKYECFKFIRGLELDVNWLHIDLRNADSLITFKQ